MLSYIDLRGSFIFMLVHGNAAHSAHEVCLSKKTVYNFLSKSGINMYDKYIFNIHLMQSIML